MHSDALTLLNSLANDSADIVFLDPPFNLGKKYGRRPATADRLSDADYATYLEKVLHRSCEVLKPGGALYLYHIPRWAIRLAPVVASRLHFRHWIAISMKNGFMRGKGLYPAHYALLYFTKGDPVTMTRPKIQAPRCPHCDEYIRDYGGYEKFVRQGINLSDVWDDISPVRHKKYKNRNGNELPLAIPRRAVEISGTRNGLFVDPFAGTGTSLIAARVKGMRFVGGDRERGNCAIMKLRLAPVPRRSKSESNNRG